MNFADLECCLTRKGSLTFDLAKFKNPSQFCLKSHYNLFFPHYFLINYTHLTPLSKLFVIKFKYISVLHFVILSTDLNYPEQCSVQAQLLLYLWNMFILILHLLSHIRSDLWYWLFERVSHFIVVCLCDLNWSSGRGLCNERNSQLSETHS